MSIIPRTRSSIPRRLISRSAILSRTLTALPGSTPTPEPAPAKEAEETLHGTAPYAQLYLILHTHEPPSSYPSRKVTTLQRKLQLELTKHKIRGTVNFGHRPDLAHLASPPDAGEEGEHYFATVYSNEGRGMRDIPRLAMEDVESVAWDLAKGPGALEMHPAKEEDEEVRVYVCTHGARDCRCGDLGGSFVQALREEVGRRKLEGTVKVGEVGHVGGHKCARSWGLAFLSSQAHVFCSRWAANMLVFPHGEW